MDKPEITILYRCTPIESINKIRPGNLKKMDLVNLCLGSAKEAFKGIDVKWILLIDKPNYDFVDMIESHFDPAKDKYEMLTTNFADWNGGNIGSFHRQLDIASTLDGKVLFLEDDYFILPESGQKIIDGLNERAWISIYDHPGYYTEPKHLGAKGYGFSFRTKGQAWLGVSSTTLTFASHADQIKEQASRMKKFGWADSEMWESMTVFIDYDADIDFDTKAPQIDLYSPVPTLATHMETPWLSPNVDWGKFFDI